MSGQKRKSAATHSSSSTDADISTDIASSTAGGGMRRIEPSSGGRASSVDYSPKSSPSKTPQKQKKSEEVVQYTLKLPKPNTLNE